MKIVFPGLVLVSAVSLATAESPYTGQEVRSVKTFSAEEVESLRRGDGMGFAKLAELNHYPGPRHVLDLADDLNLTEAQRAETEKLFEEMRTDAVVLGEKLLEAEMSLDRDFRLGEIDSDALKSALRNIGEIGADLRYVHLEAHLRQERILTKEQIAKYDELRGYDSPVHDHARHVEPRN